jgi:hypothetical protein
MRRTVTVAVYFLTSGGAFKPKLSHLDGMPRELLHRGFRMPI